MSETRYEVWWSGKKEWAEPCEVTYRGLGAFGRSSIVKGRNHCEIPTAWLHSVEPEVAPGTPCYGWNGKERPRHPFIGYLKQHNFDSGDWDLWEGQPSTETPVDYKSFDHVEPITQQPEVDWGKIPTDADRVIILESGEIRAIPRDMKLCSEYYYQETQCKITEIIPRPNS